jgi:dCMP deaminase
MKKSSAEINKKIEYFMKEVEITKSLSDDVDTQTACIIVDEYNEIVSYGANSLPTGVNKTEKRCSRPDKYKWLHHAERYAIYDCAKRGVSTNGCTMYLMWFPCADCARAIIQSGIKELVCYQPDVGNPKWGEDFVVAKELLEESSVDVKYIER